MSSRTIPGGLRAQVVAAICLLLGGAIVFTGNVVEDLLVQRTQKERREFARALAQAAGQARSVEELERLRVAANAQWISVINGGRALESGTLARGLRYSAAGVYYDEGQAFVAVRHRQGNVVSAAAVSLKSHVDLARRQARLVWTLMALEGVVLLALAYGFFTFFVVRPIRAIRVATERAAAGDLASPIGVLPRNEYGVVGASFNHMLNQLDDNQAALEARVEELAQANEEIRRTQDRLIRSENLASVGQLAAGVAHEIGNPLAVLSGYTEILADGDLIGDERADTLVRMQAQIDRIQGIIRTLLDYSRSDDGVPEPTSLAEVARETIKLVRVTSKARGVRLESFAEPLEALAIGPQLIQVCLNLSLNAIDAMQSDGVAQPLIRFRTESDGAWVTLIVEDNGPGVSDGLRARIFDPFFTTKEPGAGTGLGLSVSLRIIESFDGRIEVRESEWGGALFELTLPRARV